MKKIISILVALVLTLCLVGCASETKNTEAELKEEGDYNIHIWTDEETGVQYIVYSKKDGFGGMGGITPRLNADGSLYITTESEDTE